MLAKSEINRIKNENYSEELCIGDLGQIKRAKVTEATIHYSGLMT